MLGVLRAHAPAPPKWLGTCGAQARRSPLAKNRWVWLARHQRAAISPRDSIPSEIAHHRGSYNHGE